FRLGRVEIVIGDAIEKTILNTLNVSSVSVQVFQKRINFRDMQRLDLDAFFWIEHMSGSSSLEREGTLWPSYTSFSNVSVKRMRMSGFRGTIDSLLLTGIGSHYAHRTGASRAYIARTSAEIALRDLAERLSTALNGRIR
ncbi:MAG TPA: hypothetical protein VFH43_14835, partial [Candidatus Kapabacteria bacterium]|nr:hypothetical protein [Candidatus Kapabacteria bacterium]